MFETIIPIGVLFFICGLTSLAVGVVVGVAVGTKRSLKSASHNVPQKENLSAIITDEERKKRKTISEINNSLGGTGTAQGGITSKECVNFPCIFKNMHQPFTHKHTNPRVCNANCNELLYAIHHDFWVKLFDNEEVLVAKMALFGWNARSHSLLENVIRYKAIMRYYSGEKVNNEIGKSPHRIVKVFGTPSNYQERLGAIYEQMGTHLVEYMSACSEHTAAYDIRAFFETELYMSF